MSTLTLPRLSASQDFFSQPPDLLLASFAELSSHLKHILMFHFNTLLMILFYATEIYQQIGGRSSRTVMLLRKDALKIYSKFTGEHPCWSAISIKLQSKFIEIALWHGYSSANWLHIFRTPFPRNTSVWLLLWRKPSSFLFLLHKKSYIKRYCILIFNWQIYQNITK